MMGRTTLPQRSANASVLVVRDSLNTMTSLVEGLRPDFAVDEVGDALETLEALSTKRYGCIVCRVSDAMRVEAFTRLVDGAPTTTRPPLVFVVGTDVSIDDIAYLQRIGANWLAEHVGANEIACLVRAVTAPRK